MEEKKTLTLREFNPCGEISIHNFRTEAVGLIGEITDLLRIYLGLDSDEEVEKLIYNYPLVLGDEGEDEIQYFNSKTWVTKSEHEIIESIFKQFKLSVDFTPALVLSLFLKNRYTFLNIPITIFEKSDLPYSLFHFIKTTEVDTLTSLRIKFSTASDANLLTLDNRSYLFLKEAIEYYSKSKEGKQMIDMYKSDFTIWESAVNKIKFVNQSDNVRQSILELKTHFIPIVSNYYYKTIPDVKVRCVVIGELLAYILEESKRFKGTKDNILSKMDFYYPNIRKFLPKTVK